MAADRMKAYREIVKAIGDLNRLAIEIRDNDETNHQDLIQKAADIAAKLSQEINQEAK